MKKILVVTGIYPPSIGGPATYSKLLFDTLPEFGITASVLSFDSVRHLPKGIAHGVFLFKIIWNAMGKKIVYAQDPVSVGLPSVIACFLLRKTFFVRVAGDYAWEQSVARFGVLENIDDFQKKRYGFKVEFLRSIQRCVVGYADRVITPSFYFSSLVGNWLTPKKDITTIYNGIEIKTQNASERIPKTIVSSGRLVPWKGFRALIDVVGELSEWKLFIIGDGPERKVLEEYILKNNLSEKVFLLGTMKRIEMMQRIAEAEIYVLNTHFESFSFNIVEAMSLKTPVVATKIGNLSEIITPNEEGILVTPDDRIGLRDAILRFHADNAFRGACIENAYKKSLQFDVRVTLEKLSKLMEPFL